MSSCAFMLSLSLLWLGQHECVFGKRHYSDSDNGQMPPTDFQSAILGLVPKSSQLVAQKAEQLYLATVCVRNFNQVFGEPFAYSFICKEKKQGVSVYMPFKLLCMTISYSFWKVIGSLPICLLGPSFRKYIIISVNTMYGTLQLKRRWISAPKS